MTPEEIDERIEDLEKKNKIKENNKASIGADIKYKSLLKLRISSIIKIIMVISTIVIVIVLIKNLISMNFLIFF